ncbi:hypothetical protein [Flavobacterium hibernum]|uniref:Lipoprotein n=1 Tax=Flavobacterium hibernum TaxID=37752 RepID=A0A0D0EYY5_9FLAO|nr:hypothetical protein [Flavobacterium hibernum]KIO52511.1 hypothetical protein IW18_11250 [Flavobacterium hibernum]OXA89144.1 hypothetical protein B0A73_06085 [Flavobacterium hibernum]STO09943.1 Uncharacterised protein [Flavobacterium hibernum]
MKYFTLILAFLLFSCEEKKDVLLPKSNVTIVKDVQDHSPIYIFFKTVGKDTIADVNRKNSIISTNWILNVDKRLPLKLVIPEVMKLQKKKRDDSAHKNENAENYYSYADSIGKNMAFLPFTKVYYKMEIANNRSQLYFKKNGMIKYSGRKTYDFPKSNLKPFLDSLVINPKAQITFSYDKNMHFEDYIQCKILVQTIIDKKIPYVFINEEEEFVF